LKLLGWGAKHYIMLIKSTVFRYYTVLEPLEIINILNMIIKCVLLNIKNKKQKYFKFMATTDFGDIDSKNHHKSYLVEKKHNILLRNFIET